MRQESASKGSDSVGWDPNDNQMGTRDEGGGVYTAPMSSDDDDDGGGDDDDTNGAGGGVVRAGTAAVQILYELLVHNLFGVFEDLCGYMALPLPPDAHARGFGYRQERWLMHKEIHPESTGK